MRNGMPDSMCVAHGGGNAGIGHGDDHVGFHRMLARQQAAEHFAAFVDGAAENHAVGPREIDVLKNAVLLRLFRREVNRFDAGSGDAHHFAGLDFANVLRVEQIERAGFLATIQASSPLGVTSLPRLSGRKPRGSRTA